MSTIGPGSNKENTLKRQLIDIDDRFKSIENSEHVIVNTLNSLSDRLAKLEERMGMLENPFMSFKPKPPVPPSECEHEWSKKATGISYQFCLKKGCDAQRGDIVEPVVPSDEPKCEHKWSKNPDCEGNYICLKCQDITKDGEEHDTISISRKVAEEWLRHCRDFKHQSFHAELKNELRRAIGKGKV